MVEIDPPPELVKIILMVLAENEKKNSEKNKSIKNWDRVRKRDQFEDGAARLSDKFLVLKN